MSRDKSVWFAEEILLDAKLINFQLETGEWDAVEEMLRAEAQLSRDAETGRLRPKKASEYTLRLIAEVLHIMRLDVEQASYNRSTLGVAEQCLRLVRSCAAAGTKMQTYVSKELTILDSMLVLASEYHHPSVDFIGRELHDKYESCVTVLVQTLGNLVVNNPFNQIMIWNKFDTVILNCLLNQNDKIASAAAMIVYNILLGQPNVLPEDVTLLNSLAYMYSNGNTEYPHLIIEYLIGVENTYIERLYAKLEPESRMLVLELAHNILMSNESQDINVSVNFVRFMSQQFRVKSDCILKTVDKYLSRVEPHEVVLLLDVLATASSMDMYCSCLQNDASLFINCAFLLRSVHALGKESDNFFTSLNKLYAGTGHRLVNPNTSPQQNSVVSQPSNAELRKNESADNIAFTETTSECTESESSDQYFECSDVPPAAEALPAAPVLPLPLLGETNPNVKIDSDLTRVAFKRSASVPKGEERSTVSGAARRVSLDHKIDMCDYEPPLVLDAPAPPAIHTIAEVIPASLARRDSQPSQDVSPDDPPTEIQLTLPATSPSEVSPPLSEPLDPEGSPDTRKEAKRSQNLSTEFDLGEQLQKILGTADKGRDPPKVVREVPSVTIESPENYKSRLWVGNGPVDGRVETSVESVEQHVAFGFKAALVRILANLVWRNPHNKRMARELEVIPVLLDCCNIDARNPLIMQWVIFAVRNLCESCPENQAVISGLTLRAPVDSDLLRDMGLTLHADSSGNTIRVAPLSR